MKTFGGTPSWFNRFKDQGIITFGGTPGTSSKYPCVPRHPGWESLVYGVGGLLFKTLILMLFEVKSYVREKDYALKGTFFHFISQLNSIEF